MRTRRVFAYGMLLVLLMGGLATGVFAGAGRDPGLPVDLEGELHGAPYKISVPENWNGSLIVYAHGFRDKADHPGEVDDRSVQLTPIDEAFEDELLAQGYALAASAYSDNGWAVREGMTDMRKLVQFFRNQFGDPDRTILLGSSMGSVIGFRSIERYHQLYDGLIAQCPLGAGFSLSTDSMVTLSLAYESAFGWPEAWGDIGDVRDDLDFETEVFGIVLSQIIEPTNFGYFEFMRLMAEAPLQGYYEDNMPFTLMFFMTEVRAEVERRAHGAPYQNLNHTYSLSNDEKAYLAGLGVDADSLLAHMNDNRDVRPDPQARRYTRLYADYSGRIRNPVLTLASTGDGLHIPPQMWAYEQTVEAAGFDHNHMGLWVEDAGDCEITAEQLQAGIDGMVYWLETGTQPDRNTFFPDALGFDHTFQPDPWPQPLSSGSSFLIVRR